MTQAPWPQPLQTSASMPQYDIVTPLLAQPPEVRTCLADFFTNLVKIMRQPLLSTGPPVGPTPPATPVAQSRPPNFTAPVHAKQQSRPTPPATQTGLPPNSKAPVLAKKQSRPTPSATQTLPQKSMQQTRPTPSATQTGPSGFQAPNLPPAGQVRKTASATTTKRSAAQDPEVKTPKRAKSNPSGTIICPICKEPYEDEMKLMMHVLIDHRDLNVGPQYKYRG